MTGRQGTLCGFTFSPAQKNPADVFRWCASAVLPLRYRYMYVCISDGRRNPSFLPCDLPMILHIHEYIRYFYNNAVRMKTKQLLMFFFFRRKRKKKFTCFYHKLALKKIAFFLCCYLTNIQYNYNNFVICARFLIEIVWVIWPISLFSWKIKTWFAWNKIWNDGNVTLLFDGLAEIQASK